MRDRDRQTMEALGRARKAHPELGDLLDFYHELYTVLFQAKAAASAPDDWPSLAGLMGLDFGQPQLTFDRLDLQAKPLADLASEVTAVLLRHNPNWHAPEPLARDDVVSLARQVFETWPTLTPPSQARATDQSESMAIQAAPAAVQAIALALGAWLQRAAEAILPQLDLSLWQKGYCPICGGFPNLALLEASRGARQLLCARCDSLWDYSRVGCPFCRSKERQTYYLSEDQVYRLYACPDCNRYLKTVDLRELHREIDPRVERLVTAPLDLTAQEKGLYSSS